MTAPPGPLSEKAPIGVGIHDDIPEREYHLDPCAAPSLSRSLIKPLLELSPRHAWSLHPKLGGANLGEDDDGDETMNVGTAVHQSFLQDKSSIVRLDFKDWRTNAAKAARAEAYADDKIPLLEPHYSRAMRLIEVLETFRARTGAFTGGRPEQTAVWREDNGIWCRARIDWLPNDPEAPTWDLKTTGGRASSQAWTRICFDKGCDLQASFYGRGVEMIRGEPPGEMHFCVVEQQPPHGIAVFVMSPQAREGADDEVCQGIRAWGECLSSGEWPTYPLEEQWIWPPAWIMRGREERNLGHKHNQQRLEQVAWSKESPLGVQMVERDDFG